MVSFEHTQYKLRILFFDVCASNEVNLIVVSSRRLVFFLTGTDGGRSPTANQRQKRVKITPRKKMSLKTKHDNYHEHSFICVAVF